MITAEQMIADRVIQTLNDLVALDRSAMYRLVETRVPCNEELANHSTCTVECDAQGNASVGILGLINACLGQSKVAVSLDFDSQSISFHRWNNV